MIDLKCGNCLELMKDISNKSIDMILCDLPYGITRNKWDNIIDLDLLWFEYNRIIKDNGAIVLFGQDKFTMKVMLSNIKMHRYNLIWDKCSTTGFLNANRMPLRCHEDIMVFYKKLPTYNPQKFLGNTPSHRRCKKNSDKNFKKVNNNYGDYFINTYNSETTENNLKYPKSIISIPRVPVSKCIHPTQKPIELLEYLIKTYTNECETVLDNCMGSGSTGVACVNTNRNFIGFEIDENYFNIAKTRINNALEEKNKNI